MKTLMISDLTVSTELDSKAMTAVSGGSYWYGWGGPSYSSREHTDIDVTMFNADQFVGQTQNIETATGINAAFVENLQSNVRSGQRAANNINFY
jgi:hypothetical protein